MSYDPKCEELAAHVLTDAPELARLRAELAQHIQTEIEDWLLAKSKKLIAAQDAPSEQ